MIKTEFFTIREDGVTLVRTYSDKGMMIERDGVRYDEAIDPEGMGRVYSETDIPVEYDGEIDDNILISMLEEIL